MDFVKGLLYKTPMTNRYLTHLGSVVFLHVLILLGSWKLSESQFFTSSLPSQSSLLKVAVAAHMLAPRPRLREVAPMAPSAPVSQNVSAPSEVASVAESSLSSLARADLKGLYHAELRAKIEENKFYPLMSRRLGQTGVVVVAFTLLEDGNIMDLRIETPSAYEALNKGALEAVKKVKRFRPIPVELGSKQMEIRVPIKFSTN